MAIDNQERGAEFFAPLADKLVIGDFSGILEKLKDISPSFRLVKNVEKVGADTGAFVFFKEFVRMVESVSRIDHNTPKSDLISLKEAVLGLIGEAKNKNKNAKDDNMEKFYAGVSNYLINIFHFLGFYIDEKQSADLDKVLDQAKGLLDLI